MLSTPIHPFPARMAPEIAQQSIASVPTGGRVLDPMCGSGTVARAAIEQGLTFVGSDIDPMAVLIARVWTTPIDTDHLRIAATELVRKAKTLPARDVQRATEPHTAKFIAYWFAKRQESELARLTTALKKHEGPINDAMAVALSRIIISKESRASLARDTSHSRPHRVADSNDFDVYSGFLRSIHQLSTRLKPELITGHASVQCADARQLVDVESGSVDLVLTSPPYLNAIDYIRGHRLTLVWLGYEMASLRQIRSSSVGAERSIPEDSGTTDISQFVISRGVTSLADRHLGWIRRYASDMYAVLHELLRVVKRKGMTVLVLGNSFLRGAVIDNATLVQSLAKSLGFHLEDKFVRDIPARRRYLPPPGKGRGRLDARMRSETVLTFSSP